MDTNSVLIGFTRVIVGFTPHWSVMVLTVRCWRGAVIVTTVPVSPARAVRPARCR